MNNIMETTVIINISICAIVLIVAIVYFATRKTKKTTKAEDLRSKLKDLYIRLQNEPSESVRELIEKDIDKLEQQLKQLTTTNNE